MTTKTAAQTETTKQTVQADRLKLIFEWLNHMQMVMSSVEILQHLSNDLDKEMDGDSFSGTLLQLKKQAREFVHANEEGRELGYGLPEPESSIVHEALALNYEWQEMTDESPA